MGPIRTARYIRWLRKRSYAYPWRTARAVNKTGINPAVAAVLLTKETGGGRNVFGCDHGPGRAFCHERVTKEKVSLLLRSGLANGVGPTQLTFRPFVEAANRRGGAHRPYINMLVGFGIFKEYLNEGSLWQAAKRYNGGTDYANDFSKRYDGAHRSLRGAGVLS